MQPSVQVCQFEIWRGLSGLWRRGNGSDQGMRSPAGMLTQNRQICTKGTDGANDFFMRFVVTRISFAALL